MRRPARIKAWLSEEQMLAWLKKAPDRAAYQRRLAVWLTRTWAFHADQVARMLGVSRQAVWLWIGQFNRKGPEGLTRSGRGGRRWSLLDLADEQRIIDAWSQRTKRGEVVRARQLRPLVEKAARKKISLSYVYKLLKRHGWTHAGLRPRSSPSFRP